MKMTLLPSNTKAIKVAVVGDIGVDYYENLDLLKPGGIAFNFAYNLKVSGINQTLLISVLGTDRNSGSLLTMLSKNNFDTTGIRKITGKAPFQKISLINGERKFTGYDPGVLKKWKLTKHDLNKISKHHAVFVPLSDGMDHIFHSVKSLQSIIKITDFSQNSEFADFDKTDNVISRYTVYFDVVFVGGSGKHQKMVKDIAQSFPDKVIILTLGEKGSVLFFKGTSYLQPAIKPVKLVDTTGAGDAFQGACVASWLQTKDIRKSLYAASLIASKKITHIGSTPFTIQ